MAKLTGSIVDEATGERVEARVQVLASSGSFVHPTDAILKVGPGAPFFYSDGTFESFNWTRQAQESATWWRLPLEPGSQRIERVLIDPARRYFLDGNMADNQWYMGKDLVAPLRWSERAFTQYVHLLHWYSSLGG